MSTFEPDDGLDALLRESMHEAADTVMPAGDGLARIQQRVSARRARLRWLRPTMALGSAAAVALVTFGAYAAVHNSGTAKVEVPPPLQSATSTPTTEPTPTQTTPPPVAVTFPKRAIFPFVTAKDERAFEQEAASGTNPWQDPAAVATAWVTNFLQLSSVNQVVKRIETPTKVDVQMGRMQSDGSSQRQITVTTVHLVKFGKVWIVTGASDGSKLLRIGSPAAGSKVTSPLVVSGPSSVGADRAAYVQVRDATTPTSYGEGQTGSFGVQGWSADTSFTQPANPVGVLLVVETSQADSLPLRVTAEQVRFGSSSVSAAGPFFYGNKNGGIAKFSATDGSFVSNVTRPVPGNSSDPQLLGDTIYYRTEDSGCGTHVASVPVGGGASNDVADPDQGYSIAHYGVSQDGTKVAFFETACHVSTTPQGRLVFADLAKQTRRAIDFPGSPPYVSSDPSWEPDGVHVDATLYTGTQGYIARYDSTSTTSPTPRNACPGYDVNNGLPTALETDTSGTIWFVTHTGQSAQVVKCQVGSQTAIVAFTVSGGASTDVDVSPSGSVLVTDAGSRVWEWSGSGDPRRLPLGPRTGDVSW